MAVRELELVNIEPVDKFDTPVIRDMVERDWDAVLAIRRIYTTYATARTLVNALAGIDQRIVVAINAGDTERLGHLRRARGLIQTDIDDITANAIA